MNKTSFSVIALAILFICGCSQKSSFINTANLPDTYQCAYMVEICKQAEEFERAYSSLSEEEQAEAKVVRQTYRNQCNDAVDACRKSVP